MLDLLEETWLLGTKPTETPMETNTRLSSDIGEVFEEPGRYRRLVGKLNYLTITRPDISFAVSVVSQFMQKPLVPHWNAVLRIVRYLKGAPGRGLLYRSGGKLVVEGYTDADWAGSMSDRRSTTGYCTFLGVTW